MKKPTLEIVANWVIILTGVVATTTIAYRMWWSPSRQGAQDRRPAYAVGETLNTGQLIDYSRSARNLVFLIDPKCPHCESVMPLLKRIAQDTGGRHRVIVVGEQDSTALREYLRKHSIDGVDVVTLPRDALKIRSVPTIIMADANGRYLNSWIGRLTEPRQQAVLSALASGN